ncbi:MAG: hypothetical protein ACP5KB_06445 [Thermoprotei archaeon]
MSEKESREEETEEENFEKMIDSETTGEETGWSTEEIEVPRISFSISSLEAMLNIEELLLEALKNPNTVNQVIENIRKLREGYPPKQKKTAEKAKTAKKPQKKKSSKSKK